MQTAVANGQFGGFEGPVSDEVVFGGYRAQGRWSAALVARLCGWLAKGGTLLDVGANLGLVSIPLLVRTPAHALCFEPERHNAALLRRNAARHRVDRRVVCHEVALYDRTGALSLARCRGNSGDHRIVTAAQPPADGCRVTVRRLDDIVSSARLARPLVMKVDTQGAEARVLRGARRTLAHVDALLLEYWPFGLAHQGDSARVLQRQLASFAYGAVLPQDAAPLELVERERLFRSLAWIRPEDPGFFDLMLVRARPASRAPATDLSARAMIL